MLSSVALPLLLASTSAAALSLPHATREQPVRSLALKHTPHGLRRAVDEEDDMRAWMQREKAKINGKYGSQSVGEKRDATVQIQNQNLDASYSAVIEVGTPSQEFNVILDTGSADLWLAGSACAASACQGVTDYNTASSSSFNNLTTPFSIQYGSGSAVGYLAQDTVTLGGMTQAAQTFAIVTDTDANLISNPISGLMGMAFETLAESNAKPWWQNLAPSWSNQLFAFRLARYRNVRLASATEQEGGYVDFGALNSSHYTGDINWINLSAALYWQIPCESMTIQGTTIDINTTTTTQSRNPFASSTTTIGPPQVAVDTGTTLISVPAATAQAVFAAISGAAPVQERGYEGYYTFPCSTQVNLTLTFNGITYEVDPADFNIGPLSRGSSQCLGGIFASDLGSSSAVSWILGDTFLKNVYSIYSAESSTGNRVGFAALADGSTVSSGTAGSGSSGVTSPSAGGNSAGVVQAALSGASLGLVGLVAAYVAL